MPLYYALPLAFGLTGAIAITLILIEVVPKVLEERERRKSREGRAAVAMRRREVPITGKGNTRDENGWGYEIRQRKGRGKGQKGERDEREENQALLRPIKTEQDGDRARYVLSNPSDLELSSPDVERRPIKSSTSEPLHSIDETTSITASIRENPATYSSQTRSKPDSTNSFSPPLLPAPPINDQPWCPTALNLIDVDPSPLPPDQTPTEQKPSEIETASSFSSPVLLPTSTSTSAFASPSLSQSTEPEWNFDVSTTSSPSKRDSKKLESASEAGSDAGWFRLSDDDNDDDEDREGEGCAEELGGSREVEAGAMREWEKVGKEKGLEKGLR